MDRGPFRETLYIDNPAASSKFKKNRLEDVAGERRGPFGPLYLG
jgi:hypothetical protein